ncbi:MAG: pyruvate synthase subunit PorA, partial [Desulfobacterales bacterium]|nr:pyruvate synthase subunit PorA [Desulfobacterales bacterium]
KMGGTQLLSFIDGIANTDITKANVAQMIDQTCDRSAGKQVPEVTWISYPQANDLKDESPDDV